MFERDASIEMTPTYERLDAGEGAGLQVNSRLVHQEELIVLQRPNQFGLRNRLVARRNGIGWLLDH